MPSIDSMIKWFEDRKGKVTYSMTNRRGPSSYDCSSAGYYSLIQGGFFPVGIYIGNTDTMFNDLEKYGWKQIKANAQGNFDTKKGDIAIWGVRGQSTGSDGHFMLFIDPENVIHCSYGYNGIAESNYDWLHNINGFPAATYYRYAGSSTPVKDNPVDQVIDPGSYIKFPGSFRVDDIHDISDVWQVRTNVLCPVGFTWADNGIPAAPLVEIDDRGFATSDQSLDIGSRYVIPGKYKVLDVGNTNGRWLGKISMQGLSFWVDLAPAVEVSSKDAGTPKPSSKPKTVPKSDPIPTPTPEPEQTPPTDNDAADATSVDTTPEQSAETTPDTQPPDAADQPQKADVNQSLWSIILNFLLNLLRRKKS